MFKQTPLHGKKSLQVCVENKGMRPVLQDPNPLPGPMSEPPLESSAMWVGNLPAHIQEKQLRDHFHLIKPDLVSVAILKKSRCAFLNLKTKEAVSRAISLYHHSKLDSCLIVCRGRKRIQPGPLQPETLALSPKIQCALSLGQDIPHATLVQRQLLKPPHFHPEKPLFADRYFILKSLSPDELLKATVTCQWATQPKNEPILNRAFHTSLNVYLIFSANYTGEFFGVARMQSDIPESPCMDTTKNQEHRYGTPFQLQWIRVNPKRFDLFSHLLNSWNANKQVKVSRDGTEIETRVGQEMMDILLNE